MAQNKRHTWNKTESEKDLQPLCMDRNIVAPEKTLEI